MTTVRWVLVAGALWLGLGGPARADFLYRFDQSNYTVAPGETVDVNVFLQETGGAVLQTEGLFRAGVGLSFNEPPLPSQPARILENDDISPDLAFFIAAIVDFTPGTFFAVVIAVADELPVTVPPGGSEILLGTFRFTAGLVPGEVTNLRATDPTPFRDTITGGLVDLDPLIRDGTATITVSGAQAIPEPSGLVVLALGGLGLLGYGRCRRKQPAGGPRRLGPAPAA